MAKTKKPQVIIREIKKDIKIREIIKEEPGQPAQEAPEESLEEIATDAPSSRVFPQFSQPETARQETAESGISGQAGEKTREAAAAPLYQTQNVAEKAPRKNYESGMAFTSQQINLSRNSLILSPRGNRDNPFENREIASARRGLAGEEASKYEEFIPEEKQQTKRKLPWEA